MVLYKPLNSKNGAQDKCRYIVRALNVESKFSAFDDKLNFKLPTRLCRGPSLESKSETHVHLLKFVTLGLGSGRRFESATVGFLRTFF